MKTGIDFVDENFSANDFTDKITLIHSRVGVWKTTLACKIASYVSKQDNQNILYITNDTPCKLIIRKVLSDYANVTIDRLIEFKDKTDEITNMKGKDSTFIIKQSKTFDVIDYLREHKLNDLIIIDGYLSSELFDNLVEFKRDFNGVLIVTSQLNIFSVYESNNNFDDRFNHIILDQNVVDNDRNMSVSIITENNVFKSPIIFEHNTLIIRKKYNGNSK